jgi:four helix bundle protein
VVKSYRDLEVWSLGLDLVETIYRCTSEFPKNEIYGLAAQMRRAAVSIPSNIAEGQARSSSKEFLHFLSFSLGSLAELETQLGLTARLGYSATEISTALAQVELLGKKLHRLRTSIRQRTLVTSHQPPITSH